MEHNTKISVVTPTIRPELIPILAKCLKRQDFEGEFEWLIGSRKELLPEIESKISGMVKYSLIEEPPKDPDDFYCLCKCWNKLYALAKGELIINIQDGLHFPPDTLSKFWFHYQNNPRSLFSAIGHQYDQMDDRGVPTNKMWHDPRSKMGVTYEEVPPTEIEFCMSSIPKQALLECGGIDEEYDKAAAVCEKEMCWRLNKLGWDFFIDHTIEYKAIHHPRLNDTWEKVYKEVSTPMYTRHMNEITAGTRKLNQDNLLKYLS